MKYRSNHLDPRIIGGLQAVLMPNDVLTDERAARFSLSPLSTVGYAAECLMDFQDLGTNPSDRLFRIVEVKCGSPFPFRCRVVGNSDAIGDFSFFIPADQVAAYSDKEESKARPFTITEFNERFKLGSSVHFIEKSGGYERRVMYTGYCVDKSEGYVYLGPRVYKLQYLFDNCKLAIGYVKKGYREEPLWGVFGVDSGVYKYEEQIN